jgi:hypothetical protein
VQFVVCELGINVAGKYVKYIYCSTVRSKCVLGLSRILYFRQRCAFSGERTCYISAFWRAFVNFRTATISFMLVCPSARDSSAYARRISMTFDDWVLFENLSRKFNFHYNLTRKTGTLLERLCTFMITSHRILLRLSNTGDKSCSEKQNTFHV